MNPPTLHNAGVAGPGAGVDGVPELKIHGAAMVTFVPGAMLEKSPESCSTIELFQRLTLVAVARDVVSNVTTPPKSIVPCMVAALAGWQKKAQLSRLMARARRTFLKLPFLLLRSNALRGAIRICGVDFLL